MNCHTIAGSKLKAVIKADGAELCSVQNSTGYEFLWQAGPTWPRHAPNLFPIVGSLKNDVLRHRGREYRMTRHGFARDRIFTWEDRSATTCKLSLRDDEWTRAIYPFSFLFELSYAVADESLMVTYTIRNTGDEVLPACMGAHPAFHWPLDANIPKNAHRLEFSDPETSGTRRLSNGLLLTETFPSPIKDRELMLAEELFITDAIILDKPASRKVRYSAPGAPGLEVSWDEGFSQLGIWSRQGADLLCIEPWQGMASPVDFDGEITGKPGMMLIQPGSSRQATYQIRLCND
jgi:galactose mutarotase-like enzyme